MTPKVKESKEFAKWLRDWIAAVQQDRAMIQHAPPEKRRSEHTGHNIPTAQTETTAAHDKRVA